MKKELLDLRPALAIAAVEVAEVMQKIQKDKEEVEFKKSLVNEDEANQQAAEAGKLRQECLMDLAKALPLIESKVTTKCSNLVWNQSILYSGISFQRHSRLWTRWNHPMWPWWKQWNHHLLQWNWLWRQFVSCSASLQRKWQGLTGKRQVKK